MAKVFIEETTLTAIGDAIRVKEGTTELIPVPDMATRISAIESGGGDITDENLTFTGNCDHIFRNGNWNFILDKYSNKIKIVDANSLGYTFSDTKKEDLSMLTVSTKSAAFNGTFNNSTTLKKLPKVAKGSTVQRYFSSIFNACNRLPSDEINTFLTSLELPAATDTNTACSAMFTSCWSARDLTPAFEWLDAALNNYTGTSTSYVAYNQMLYALYALDKVTNLPTIRVGGARTSNAFSSTFSNCFRLSELMFKTDNGTPYSVNWKAQTIDLSSWVGYTGNAYQVCDYNAGITVDKEVNDDISYQALKNDPDWFATNIAYCRYNHDSAVNTINSLPDTSAYLATAGGTNTIKFNGMSGEKTDGGAINTLTAEEIAVATAKGWTVTLV